MDYFFIFKKINLSIKTIINKINIIFYLFYLIIKIDNDDRIDLYNITKKIEQWWYINLYNIIIKMNINNNPSYSIE